MTIMTTCKKETSELFPLVRQPSLSLFLSAFKGDRVPEAYDHNDYINNTTIKKRHRNFSHRFGSLSLLMNVLSSSLSLSLSFLGGCLNVKYRIIWHAFLF